MVYIDINHSLRNPHLNYDSLNPVRMEREENQTMHKKDSFVYFQWENLPKTCYTPVD